METLFIVSKGLDKPSTREIIQREKNDLEPRTYLLEEEVSAHLLDERHFKALPKSLQWIYNLLPVFVAQILEALRVQSKYDVVLSYYEKVALPFAYLQKIFRLKTPHVLMTTWFTARKKVWFLKRVHNHLAKIIVWSSVQYKYAVDEIGVDTAKIKLIKRGVDQKFWRPIGAKVDMICSVGAEMRDYVTLVEALRPLQISCHIATGAARGVIFNTVKTLYNIDDIPDNITIGGKNPVELRNLYARSQFVVVPLLKTDTDNGLTVILEAMAMGKPVICSRVKGQVDVIQEGITGIFVPQGDAKALRLAILELWSDPERCKEMGKSAREYIIEYHCFEQYVESISEEVQKLKVGNRVKRRKPAFHEKFIVEA